MLFTEFNMEDALEVRYEEGKLDGLEEGLAKGLAKGAKAFISLCLGEGKTEAQILEKLEQGFSMSHENAKKIFDQFTSKHAGSRG